MGHDNFYLPQLCRRLIFSGRMNKGAEFGIIVNDRHQFSVWPTNRRLPPDWVYTGHIGTLAEMRKLVRQQFVETTPAKHIPPDERFTGLAMGRR